MQIAFDMFLGFMAALFIGAMYGLAILIMLSVYGL